MRRKNYFLINTILLLFCGLLMVGCNSLTIQDPSGGLDDDTKKEAGILLIDFDKGSINSNSTFNRSLVETGSSIALNSQNLDTNSFILKIVKDDGSVIYNGLYSAKPAQIKLDAASYEISVNSVLFDAPAFNKPCYGDRSTVVIEKNKITRLSLLCRMVNSGVKFGFTQDFKKRFPFYTLEVYDANDVIDYPYSESRYLFVTPGDIILKMRKGAGDDAQRVIIARKSLMAREVISLNLHSSTSEQGGGDQENYLTTGISLDTLSIRRSEELIIGKIRDGSSREMAIYADEMRGYVGQKGVWVCGYICGYLTTSSLVFEPPFNTETNIAISSVKGAVVKDMCSGISLPSGDIRAAVNLKANPGNLGRMVYFKGTIVESYFGITGMNSVTEFLLE